MENRKKKNRSYLILYFIFLGIVFSPYSILESLFSGCFRKFNWEMAAKIDSPKSNFNITRTGYFFCSYPEYMHVESPEDFRVWITEDSIRDFNKFDQTLLEGDTIITQKISVGIIMSVELFEADTSEHNFSIIPYNSFEQIVDKHDPATWNWRITPLREGNHDLIVLAKVKILNENFDFLGYKDLPVLRRSITVGVLDQMLAEAKHSKSSVVVNNDSTSQDYISHQTGDTESEESKNHWFWLFAPIFILVIVVFFYRNKKVRSLNPIEVQEFEAFNLSIKKSLEKSEVEVAFEDFKVFLVKHPNKNLSRELTLLQSNFSSNEARSNAKLIDDDEYDRNRARVVEGVMGLLDRFEVKEPINK